MVKLEKTKTGLLAPRSYIIANAKVRELVCNGCGPKAIEFMISDKLWGLDIEECCDIHDWMWNEGEDEDDRDFADDTFHDNMVCRVEATPCAWLLRRMRIRTARLYYNAVRGLGGFFYKSGIKRGFRKLWNGIKGLLRMK